MTNIDNRGAPSPRGSGNSALYFIVGALVVAVLVIAFFMYGGNVGDGAATSTPPAGDTNVTVEAPATGTAAPAAPAAEPPPAPAQ